MAELETDPGIADPLVADLKVLRKRILKTAMPAEPEAMYKLIVGWLCNEIIPSISAATERIIEVDDLVEEMVEQQDSYLQESDATQIIGTIQIAGAIMGAVREKLGELDDVTAKRIGEAITEYERSAQLSMMIIANAAVEDEGDDDEGDDDQTPVEVPKKKESKKGDDDDDDDGLDEDADTVSQSDE